MKKLCLLLCFWLIVIAAKSQNESRLSIGLNSSFLVNNRLFTYHKSDDFINYRNSKEKYKLGFDCSATIHYRFKNNLSFTTGFGYSILAIIQRKRE